MILWDYIDYGNESCQTLYYLKNLSKEYKNQIIVLKGNHETMFLDWLVNPIEMIHWLLEDEELNTVKTFLTDSEFNMIYNLIKRRKDMRQVSKIISKIIIENHNELITWLNKLPYYYETKTQIFVH